MTVLPWRDIDTVLLDMDGTLLDLHYDNHFWLEHLPQRYAELHGISRAMADLELTPLFEGNAGGVSARVRRARRVRVALWAWGSISRTRAVVRPNDGAGLTGAT